MNAPRPPLSRDDFARWLDPPLWGMVHLAPLPGSCGYTGEADLPLARALEDADKLVAAGFGGLVVENYGDIPFFGDRVPAVTVAAMTRIAAALRHRHPQARMAINCLRNDADAALAVATVVGADAIRVNVHVGAALTDQGVLTGQAAHTLRRRCELSSGVRILADLRVKHAAPLAAQPLAMDATDLRERGLADVLLITGSGTGRPASVDDVAPVRDALPDAPLVVASGVSVDSAATWARVVDGAIIGSALMRGGVAGQGVDPDNAKAVLAAWRAAH